ncbi:WD-repeat protein BING4 [Giardia muris]|uniref:WD-repeat protein BING4 n=1 Tax=Giardia muris TaxID=5742 RepID=A0A4Z1T5X2_GIAMU|nr:WD-repeat protein BING4 [Giardia muris]|eukprot:TNJ28537.1 WD-repeat protein BING4 [Giardia muris]
MNLETYGSLQIGQRQRAIRTTDLGVLSTAEETGIFGAGPNVSQIELRKYLPDQAANNIFELSLHAGPYLATYDRSGAHMLIAGQAGHLAMIRMADKSLMMETNVSNDSILDACFLNNNALFCAARQREVTIYDDNGLEIHHLSRRGVLLLDFLPYHWLLTSICLGGFIEYVDISTGETVSRIATRIPRASCLRHNPENALLGVSSLGKTSVSLFSPNIPDNPAMIIDCGQGGIVRHCFSSNGEHLITASVNGLLKIFDLRNYGTELTAFSLPSTSLTDLSISQTDILAVASAHRVDFFKLKSLMEFDYASEETKSLLQSNPDLEKYRGNDSHFSLTDLKLTYLTHQYDGSAISTLHKGASHKVTNMGRTGSGRNRSGTRSGNANSITSCTFRPYFDDCLLGLTCGVQSIIVPGSGAQEYDRRVANPFESRRERNNRTVRDLLDKIPYQLIGNREALTSVYSPTDKERVQIRYGLIHDAMAKRHTRNKKKRSMASKLNTRESMRRVDAEIRQQMAELEKERKRGRTQERTRKQESVLDRFRT